jgi:hypothetical protein
MASDGIPGVQALAAAAHPRAAPVATGGRVANSTRITDVREAILQTTEPWRRFGRLLPAQVAAFDLALGRTLHNSLEIIPADAAHTETWSFLTLIVLPDIAVFRFPDMHADRLMGGQRNVLRRPWIRQEVLGDLLHSAERPLGEDELVGLFERTKLARNWALIRRLAVAIMEYDGRSSRSDWVRELNKRVTFATGPRLLDSLSDNELDMLIRGTETAAAPPINRAISVATDGTQATATATEVSMHKLEENFERALIGIYQRALKELGYDAVYLVRMATNEGGVATARTLVMSSHPSDGFVYLWKHQRLDLTVEALVTQKEFAALFDAQVIAHAAERLREYGRTP